MTDKVVCLLSSLDAEVQQLCAAILLNVSNQKPDKYESLYAASSPHNNNNVNSAHNTCTTVVLSSFESPSEDSGMIQTLLLVKHFGQDEEARRYAQPWIYEGEERGAGRLATHHVMLLPSSLV